MAGLIAVRTWLGGGHFGSGAARQSGAVRTTGGREVERGFSGVFRQKIRENWPRKKSNNKKKSSDRQKKKTHRFRR